jgi:hypothetical protein
MDDRELPPGIRSRGPGRWGWPLAVAAWCGLIFATSSTVITPRAFFAWIAAHALSDEAAFRKFAAFWGFAWFAIVKGWHATEFALLFLVLRAALDRIAPAPPRRNIVLSLCFCILFAVSDEYHQTFVPERNGTWTDVAIDGLGACLAALFSDRRGRPTDRQPGPRAEGCER